MTFESLMKKTKKQLQAQAKELGLDIATSAPKADYAIAIFEASGEEAPHSDEEVKARNSGNPPAVGEDAEAEQVLADAVAEAEEAEPEKGYDKPGHPHDRKRLDEPVPEPPGGRKSKEIANLLGKRKYTLADLEEMREDPEAAIARVRADYIEALDEYMGAPRVDRTIIKSSIGHLRKFIQRIEA